MVRSDHAFKYPSTFLEMTFGGFGMPVYSTHNNFTRTEFQLDAYKALNMMNKSIGGLPAHKPSLSAPRVTESITEP